MGRWWRWRRRPPPQPPKRDAPPPGPDPDEEAAARWVSTRDPALRAIVLEAGAVAPYEEYWWLGRIDPFRGRAYTNGHLITLALHDRLDEANPYAAAGAVPELLADIDPGVVAGARSFCARATGRALGRLWRLHWYLTGADAAALRALLLDNPAPVPDEALDEAWLSWVSTPDVRLWERLGRPARNGRAERWSRVALAVAAPEELCDAVLAGSTPDPVRERALAACRESGHVPADPARRAAFFLLTGQWQRYRELDGDGALLAEAYQDGTVRQRLRLRTAMAEARGVDLARVLASDAMRKTERDYLLRHLAARGLAAAPADRGRARLDRRAGRGPVGPGRPEGARPAAHVAGPPVPGLTRSFTALNNGQNRTNAITRSGQVGALSTLQTSPPRRTRVRKRFPTKGEPT
jgi:hypothetical protein